MPVFRSGMGLAPDWCEMRYFEIVELPVRSSYHFGWIGPKEKLIVGQGCCQIAFGNQVVEAEPWTNLDLRRGQGQFHVLDVDEPTTLIRMCGHWGEKTGGSGLFQVAERDNRQDRGDPVDYPKRTGMDSHYHDCDEYWILYRGRGVAASEGQLYEVGPGDCVATAMGEHHDFPLVHEPVQAVYFETTLRGQMRRGHLWNHAHGPAQSGEK